ncbi:MAG: DUF3991 and TOPRIM domain-containing protein [Clostridiales bacterium]|jgi:hypothetical protein|nr:DUF3991 and TOPRIM domain-containing protein [Clostridiales bacterium]MBQ1574172.1 DUF3991 and TOPRIM domain-containing protein [Clostridiales bacterium]
MPYYTEKQIDQARSIDLLTYLQSFEPTELVHVRGNTYCTREHDSLKISNGKWMWWSRGFGGNSALDYLIKVKGMQFMDAMKILTKEGTDLHDTDAKKSRKPDCDVKRKLLLPDKSETNFEVIRYLTSRGIDSDVIKACIDEGLLYESLPYHNCIFVGFDETGNAAYAFYRATTGERLMGEAAGSDKRYSFRIDRAGSTLHVFESAIDLLSYATIMKMRTGEWRAEPMLSLGGVYAPSTNNKQTKLPIALQNMTHNQTQINTIALHLDNDYAGRSATRSISEQLGNKYIVRDEPPAYGKDCNDYLQQLQRQKRKRQMER